MNRFGWPLLISLAGHALLVLAVVPWFFLQKDAPLGGGGGGSGVTVEIVGGRGPEGVGGKETQAPLVPSTKQVLPELQDGDRMTALIKTKPESPKKAKAGRPGGDDVPIGSPAPFGPGQGSSAAGPGSGGGQGTNAILGEIHARIERVKRYPMMARRMNVEGVSFVSFLINAEGQPQGLALKSSSGSSVLDEEALATIRRAAPFPTYAEPLEIGIRFKIGE